MYTHEHCPHCGESLRPESLRYEEGGEVGIVGLNLLCIFLPFAAVAIVEGLTPGVVVCLIVAGLPMLLTLGVGVAAAKRADRIRRVIAESASPTQLKGDPS